MAEFVKSRGSIVVIYCCGKYHEPFQTVRLLPDFKYRNRKLEVLVCPNCGALVAELTQFNVITNKYETYRPKRKKTAGFIRHIQEGKLENVKIKYGTKERAGFVYGVNIMRKNGKIYQYAVDFNGEKKLVKVVG